MELNIEDADALVGYLRGSGHIGADELVRVEVLHGGVSNRTVRVDRAAPPDLVIKQALPRLRVEAEWYCDPARIVREAAAMRRLRELVGGACVPQLIFLDEPHSLLAMEAVPRPHDNWKSLLLAGCINPDHVEQFARLLSAIHSAGTRQRGGLATEFGDQRFFESLRIEPFYQYTAERLPAASSFLTELSVQVRGRLDTLVHGDYSPKNVLIYDGHVVLLDFEVVHFGDPAFDVGFALAHLLSKANHLSQHRAALAEASGIFWSVYRESLVDVDWTDGLEIRTVSHGLGCLLARVAGRSPVEYLAAGPRRSQQAAALQLMDDPPSTVVHLVSRFLKLID